MAPKRRRRPGATARQRSWQRSRACKDVLRKATEKSRTVRLHKVRCGARRKTDGLPCRRQPLKNGRCRLHGGASVGGAAWHVVQWPDPILEPERYAKKLKEITRRRRKQAARVAAMTPERRRAYVEWHRTRKAGGAAGREKARRDREMAALLSAKRDRVVDPVAEALEAQLAAVRADRARLEALLAEPKPDDGESDD